jgi:hypothetical protein
MFMNKPPAQYQYYHQVSNLNPDDYIPTHMLTRGYNCDEIIQRQLPMVLDDSKLKKRDSKHLNKEIVKKKRRENYNLDN